MLFLRSKVPQLHASHASFTSLRRVDPRSSTRRVARALGAALALLAIAMLFVPWQQTSFGQGKVIAYAPNERQQTVDATISGRAQRWFVNEGDVVAAGDPLVELVDNDPLRVERLRQELASLEQKLLTQQLAVDAYTSRYAAMEEGRTLSEQVAEAKIAMAERELEAARDGAVADQADAATATLNLERTRALRAEGLSSQRDLELAELKAEQSNRKAAQARAKISIAEADLAAAKLGLNLTLREADAKLHSVEADLQAARGYIAATQKDLVDMQGELSRQEAQRITAPLAGTVLKVLGGRGNEQVKAGDPLLIIVPEAASRAVELWVDGNDVPLLHAADGVRLQMEGWPAVQFSGWPSVAVGTFGGQIAFIDATDDGQGRFRVLVVPDPNEPEWPGPETLRQGARAKGWVLLSQVSLGYELWRQLNNFPPSVTLDELKAKSEAKAKGQGSVK